MSAMFYCIVWNLMYVKIKRRGCWRHRFWRHNFGTRDFLFNLDFWKLRNRDKWYGNFRGKFRENPGIVKFQKSAPFNRKFRKFRKFREESQVEEKFPVRNLRKLRDTSFPEIISGKGDNLRFGYACCSVVRPLFTWYTRIVLFGG